MDLGSGGGRLVLAAAAMSNPFKKVRGVEFLPSLHCLAEKKLVQAHNFPDFLASEVVLENCSWDAPALDLSSVDIAFACTSLRKKERESARAREGGWEGGRWGVGEQESRPSGSY